METTTTNGANEMTTKTALTIDQLMDTLIDERHIGFGFAGIRHYSFSRQMRAAEAVVTVASDLGWDYEDLFTWSNSKPARWFADEMSDDDADAEQVARKYVVRWNR